jgi:hypothetical protein
MVGQIEPHRKICDAIEANPTVHEINWRSEPPSFCDAEQEDIESGLRRHRSDE